METIIEKCCGLYVHQGTVVACILTGNPNGKVKKEIRTVATFTRDLLALRDWLQEQGITHIGMESTGVYWKPVYALLEEHFELIVGNAQHIRQVPGRKTDVKDSEWIARLVRHGLIRPSFIPPKPLRELRELLRYRRKLVESRTAERNRTLKLRRGSSRSKPYERHLLEGQVPSSQSRRGGKRAAVAIGHKILTSAYAMLSRNVDYADLGETYLDRLDKVRTITSLRRCIERLGFDVNLVSKVV